ncbi:MAG: bifunctional phosphopantothenoylcysteine decarboxylase/phosphopantothenate--cysteine ligase CoaBC [Bacillota bacterium]|jgi:phosphopantothenoylcysteine decarboxylase/phosphopantothenate--cysteine ligase|nr:bifunctional phosphopantothenoylcysteine decarboxylase/phosphopantothenate--cysteine ligase CoaBC [Bacillota bacterium]HOB91270.1 bifunctional phosphopantothenoylcysteine decarboxylase/phosphopantothenate--cysteine ligase CoaBC [Bacillota bacterium]HPZ53675.1 bifunctional phosphopantothenoylcysteine decarboxylase/phosphopantothenate--cysteine ligase CoaBC [Bacillota bacterium]HQD17236.1 bifunctional phosphopantothenoylcysteine decarboxylase/phosphopantothenate--cysteine ligase CoaBC [Bacillot
MASPRSKCMVLGVTGGIAAYKSCELVRLAIKSGLDVRVVMTKSAAEFVSPLTFRTLSGNPVSLDMFEEPAQWDIEHVSLAQRADVLVVAPATANIIGKMASGIADDLLTSTILACRSPKVIAPAMNTAMWENPITQRNIETLKSVGFTVLRTEKGLLACGDVGYGRMIAPDLIFQYVLRALRSTDDWRGVRCLVTAGPTREPIDPVRFVGNRSSGKMGYAIATELWQRGADVVLVTGPVSLPHPEGIKTIRVETTEEMLNACQTHFDESDISVFAAAPADFTPAVVADSKIKKGGGSSLTLELVENPDISATLCKSKRPDQIAVGFAAETDDLIANAMAKLERKGLDMIVANDITAEGAGFEVDTNIATLIHKDGQQERLGLMSKSDLARLIVDRIWSMRRPSPGREECHCRE